MHEYSFDRSDATPLVTTVVAGPRRSGRLLLVFDTGCAITQIRASTIRGLGFNESTSIAKARAYGVEGETEIGEVFKVNRLFVLEKKFVDVPIASFPMKHFEGEQIDGLLGWDLIKELHLEMNGPKGLLKVFSKP